MQHLVELWKAAKVGDPQPVEQYLTRAAKIWGGMMDDSTLNKELLFRIRRAPNQPGELADLMLKAVLQQKLRGRLSLVFSPPAHDALVPQPDSLLGALWLQFAQAVIQNKQYRRCESCAEWFEISPQVARAERVFCSTACRSRAYRQRRDEARRLNADGVPLEQIARDLQSDAETVSGWIKAKVAPPE
jgi:hypothetical protein